MLGSVAIAHSVRNDTKTNDSDHLLLRTWEFVDLCSQDEITLGKAVYLVRPGCHRNAPPPQENVRMMSLLLGKGADSIYECESTDEIREVVALRNMMLINDSPSPYFVGEFGKFFALQWRHSSSARDTVAFGKIGHLSAI